MGQHVLLVSCVIMNFSMVKAQNYVCELRIMCKLSAWDELGRTFTIRYETRDLQPLKISSKSTNKTQHNYTTRFLSPNPIIYSVKTCYVIICKAVVLFKKMLSQCLLYFYIPVHQCNSTKDTFERLYLVCTFMM